MVKRTTEERIAALKQQLDAKKSRLDRLQAKQTAAERKTNDRRKIIVGGAVLTHAQHDAGFAAALKTALKKAVTRDKDKEAISDLLS